MILYFNLIKLHIFDRKTLVWIINNFNNEYIIIDRKNFYFYKNIIYKFIFTTFFHPIIYFKRQKFFIADLKVSYLGSCGKKRSIRNMEKTVEKINKKL